MDRKPEDIHTRRDARPEEELLDSPSTEAGAPHTQTPEATPSPWVMAVMLQQFASLLSRCAPELPAAQRKRPGEDPLEWLRRAFRLQPHCRALEMTLRPLRQHARHLQRHLHNLRHNLERLCDPPRASSQPALRILQEHSRGAQQSMKALHSELNTLRQPPTLAPHSFSQALSQTTDPQEQLSRIHQALQEQMLHFILHEISGPMSVVMGNLPELCRHLASLERRESWSWADLWDEERESLADLTEALTRILGLLEDISAWGRPATPPERALIPVEEVVRLALRLSQGDYQEVMLELEPNLMVRGDRGQLAQILIQLLNQVHDALRRADAPLHVRVCARSQGPWICLDVIHQAHEGSPQPVVRHQTPHDALERTLAQSHGGDLERSTHGRDVTFTLRLPRPVPVP